MGEPRPTTVTSGPIRRRGALWAVVAASLVVAEARSAQAQDLPASQLDSEQAPQPTNLQVWVMTFGPGDEVFFKFGHNAVLVTGLDADGRRFRTIYDYGIFDGSSPTLVADFLQGRMDYWVASTSFSLTLRRYTRQNRAVYGQRLRLTQAQALRLYRMLEENIKPANSRYRYDYYYDNCSTKVRDILDVITGGAVRRAFSGPATMSLRDHSLRHTADAWHYYVGLDLGLANVDGPLDRWDESFLPEKLRESLRLVKVEIDGEMVDLVAEERVFFRGTRPEVRAEPPVRWPIMLAVGAVVGLFWAGLGFLGRRLGFVRVLFVLSSSVFAATLALFGVLLVFLWTSTDHSIAYGNENIFNLAPWGVLAPVAGLLSLVPRWRSVMFWFFLSVAAFSVLGVLAKVLPGLDQVTHRIVVLLLPTWVGLTLGARFIAQPPSSASARSAK